METKNIYQKLFEVKKAGITLQRDTKAFNYKYATLDQIQKKLWEVLQEQGLLVTHYISENHVITTITDIQSESSIRSSIPLTEWTKPQDKGSEITYYRRYNLLSLLDLEVEDDDGKKAQDSKSKQDIMDFINRVKEENDVNHLDVIYKEFTQLKWSQKQIDWMIKECKERKENLIK